ncbi:MAG: MarR family winged helix-turn-helix transcriptional regulator [Alphaproteobacteria bacterium]
MIDTYLDIVHLIERLHRHFLDVLRTELRRIGVADINSVQALLLYNIGESEIVIHELKDRGYYYGSNVSYNIKKLTDYGYLNQERSPHDRRATVLRLTEKGLALRASVQRLQDHLSNALKSQPGLTSELESATRSLLHVERTWSEYVRYGRA